HMKRLERREGNRHALIARIDCGSGRTLTIVNVHLEVFGTARCRSVQMKFLLDRVPSGPGIITGDFNTNTFSRGSAYHVCRSMSLLAFTDARSRVLAPWRYEPLFRDLSNAGFKWRGFNDNHPTCAVDLASLEDRTRAPAFVRKFILSRCRFLPLRLDFICCRGLQAVSPGRTITDLPCQPSDHLPITCEVAFSRGTSSAVSRQMNPLSYIWPKAAVKPSPIHGNGLFAVEPIAAGEIVCVKGGHIFGRQQLGNVNELLGPAEIQISENLFIGPLDTESREGSMIFSNHCCNPNIAVQGQIVFVAMRDIAAGEELTHDWATTDDDTYEMECRCNSPNCRKVI